MEILESKAEEAANRGEQGKVYKVGRYTPWKIQLNHLNLASFYKEA